MKKLIYENKIGCTPLPGWACPPLKVYVHIRFAKS